MSQHRSHGRHDHAPRSMLCHQADTTAATPPRIGSGGRRGRGRGKASLIVRGGRPEAARRRPPRCSAYGIRSSSRPRSPGSRPVSSAALFAGHAPFTDRAPAPPAPDSGSRRPPPRTGTTTPGPAPPPAGPAPRRDPVVRVMAPPGWGPPGAAPSHRTTRDRRAARHQDHPTDAPPGRTFPPPRTGPSGRTAGRTAAHERLRSRRAPRRPADPSRGARAPTRPGSTPLQDRGLPAAARGEVSRPACAVRRRR